LPAPDRLPESRGVHVAHDQHLQHAGAFTIVNPSNLQNDCADADVQVGGARSVQFRWEVFNLINHVNFNADHRAQQCELRPDSDGRRSANHAVRAEVHVLMRRILVAAALCIGPRRRSGRGRQRLAVARSTPAAGVSPLKQIARTSALKAAWTFDTGAPGLQVTPLISRIMYNGRRRHHRPRA
jgi:hypothetical protein